MSFTPPETRYARSGDLSIAYQVVGEGPLDLVFVPGFVSHVELNWEAPTSGGFFRRLASFSRLIIFDKPGTGLSDPLMGAQTLEQRMDDVRAVMDAAGSERAALFGLSEGGPMSILFAATYPKRATHLVLCGSCPRFSRADDYPYKILEPFDLEKLRNDWGNGRMFATHFVPSHAGDPKSLKNLARAERLSASPRMAASVLAMAREIDVRPILSAISVPTLVLHRRDEKVVPVAAARYAAERIPGARMVEFDGDDHFPWLGDSEPLLAETERFLTGTQSTADIERVLATVMFTDIVDSTKVAAAAGDAKWRAILDRHDTIVREQIAAFRGREIKNTGDGFLATFDRPAASIRCASNIVKAVRDCGLEVRAGLHTGECELRDDDISGIAVHIGARVAALAAPGEVVVSRTVRDLVAGSGLTFDDRGSHTLKGVDGEWQLYAARA